MTSASIKILCENNQSISLPFQAFVLHSTVFSEQAFSGNFQKEIDCSMYNFDSVAQFVKACQNNDPTITPENVFGYDSLCDTWGVDENIRSFASDFLKQHASKLLINHILFKLDHNQDISQQKDQLKKDLLNHIADPNLKEVPFDILKDCVDFSLFQDDDQSFQKVYGFCLQYLDEHQDEENCSELFSTLDVSKVTYTDLSKLTGKPYFDRASLNDSLGQVLSQILERTSDMPEMVEKIRTRYSQDLEDMLTRQLEYQKDQQESKLLRIELEKEKKMVENLTKKVQDLKDLIFPFLKETKEVREQMFQQQKKMLEESQNKFKHTASSPLYYPNYGSPSSISWSNRNVSGDGWVLVQGGCSNYSSPSYVTVANKKNMIVSGNGSGSYYTYSSVFFPIRQGQKLSYNKGSTTSTESYYIQNKSSSKVTAPDWQKAALKQWQTSYNAPCDGWLYAECGSNGSRGYIQIGSTNITICQQNGGYQSYSSAFVPISSGDQFTFYHQGYPGPCFFIPGLKESEVGMPNYDQETSQSWNQEYESPSAGWIYAQCQSYSCSSNNPGYLMVGGCPLLISKEFSGYYDNASVIFQLQKEPNILHKVDIHHNQFHFSLGSKNSQMLDFLIYHIQLNKSQIIE